MERMIDINQFKTNLSDYLDRIKQLRSDDYDEKTKNSVYLDYKELYAVYSTLSIEQISENFSINEIKAINCLSLGVDNENDFNKLILQFQKNSEIVVLNVVDFIKSRDGFELINKDGDFKKFTDDELVEIFGGLFGVQIAKDCVKSLKAEKIGRVVGYALSNLFDHHILEFNELKKKDSNTDFCSFLKEKIQESDFECSYLYNEKGNDLEILCSINEFKNANITEIRGRNRVDHCFVNHKEKFITFGQSTSNKDTESQGYSYFKAYLTLKHLASMEKVDGKPNPYFGYKLRPYLMLGGRFVVDDESVTQEKGRDFKKMLPNASKGDLETLGQMQYFRLFGNAVNSEQVNSLALFNVFVAGCDTLNLYKFSEKMAVLTSEKDKNKLCFSVLTNYVKNVCEILSNNDLSFSTGGKGDLALFLDDVHSISKNLFVNFNHELTQQEYEQSISPLYKSINNLREKIKPITGQFGNDVLNELRTINKNFSSLDTYNDEIRNCDLAPIASISWKQEQLQEIIFDVKDLSFISKIASHIAINMGLQGRKFFTKFSDSLNHKINYDFASKTDSFSANKNQFLKAYGYKPFANFLDKASFVLDERLTPEKFSEKAVELVNFINDDLIKTYPSIKAMLSESAIQKIKKSM